MPTKIAWADESWNVTTGCSHVSEGCRFCYAERLSLRFGWSKKPWTAQNAAENVVLHPERLDVPLHWKKPRMIFVDSMSDLFHEQIPAEFIGRVFDVMSECPQHTFMVLTKRPQRMLDVLAAYLDTVGSPYQEYWSHVWLGVSCEDQKAADERIPILLQIPAAIRFVSAEPLLGRIMFTRLSYRDESAIDALRGEIVHLPQHIAIKPEKLGRRLNWVIVGSESGPNRRPMSLSWARLIRDECVAAGVPFFLKQTSGFRPGMNTKLDGVEWKQMPEIG